MKLLTTLLTLLIGISFFACKKDFKEDPNLSGHLVGFVYTFDEYANILNDHSNVSATIKTLNGTNSVLTDAYGRFEFKNLKAGTYDIEVKKEGYNSIKMYGIKHLGGEPTFIGLDLGSSIYPAVFYLYQTSTITVKNLSYRNDSLIGTFNFTSNEHPQFMMLRVNFSKNTDFDMSTAQLSTSIFMTLKNDNYIGLIYHPYYPFEIGTTYYVSANANFYNQGFSEMYNRSIIGNSSYYDYDTNQTIYPNTGNESAKFSFTVSK